MLYIGPGLGIGAIFLVAIILIIVIFCMIYIFRYYLKHKNKFNK